MTALKLAPTEATLPPDPWTTPTMSVSDVASFLNISRPTAYRAVRDGKIPTSMITGSARVRTTWLYTELGLPLPVHPGFRDLL